MGRIVTFEDAGVSKVADYSDCNYPNDYIIRLLHDNSYREHLAEEVLKNLSSFARETPINKISKISLGYAVEEAAKKGRVSSTISKIEFHNKELKNFGVTHKQYTHD